MKTDSFLNRILLALNRPVWLPMLLLAAWAALAPRAEAAGNLLWDVTSGTTGAQDGGGTWNAGNLNWWDATAAANVVWNSTSNAVFGANNGSGLALTVTLGSPITAYSLQFAATGSTNYLIAGGGNTLTLSSGGSINIGSTLSPVISANIAATAGLTAINGPGALNQTGNYDATGQQFNVNSGTFNFSGTTLNASKLIMVGGGTINISNGTATVNGNYFGIGDGSAGNFNMWGGTLNDTAGAGLFIGNAATGSLTVNGGAVNISTTTGNLWIGSGYNGTGNGNGTLTINGGSFSYSSGVTKLAYASGQSGTINLNGGTFFLNGQNISGGAGGSTNNFNGGTLKFTANNNSMLTVSAANIRNFGAIIDDGGFTVTNAQALVHSTITGDNATDGGLTKSGAGLLVLTAVNTYNGPTIVQAGTLILNGQLGTGLLTVSNGATLGGTGGSTGGDVTFSNSATLSPGTQTRAGTLGVGGKLIFQAGSKFDINLTNSTTVGGGVNDLVTVVGDVQLNGAVTFTLYPLASRLAPGTYRLISYSGSLVGPASNIALVGGPRGSAIDTSTSGQINLVVTGAASNLVWRGSASANWNFTDTNWFVGPGLDRFFNLDAVLFDDTASQFNVSLPVTVLPTNVAVNANNAYTISGAGKISGLTGLTKGGTNLFTLSTTNDFTGPILVTNGTLKAGVTNAFGFTSGITVTNGGQVDINGLNARQNNYTISGFGPDGRGAIINGSAASPHGNVCPVASVTLVGNAGVWSYPGGLYDFYGGTITGNGYKLFKYGQGKLDLYNCGAVNTLDELVINEGIVYSEGFNNSFASNVTVNAGTQMGLFGDYSHNARVVLNGGTLVGGGNATTHTILNGPVILSNDCYMAENVFYNPAGKVTNFRLNGGISGPGSLTKNNTNWLYLNGTNTYTGNTYLNGGRIILLTTGSILNSPFLSVASGTVFDVSLATNTTLLTNVMVLSANQALGGLGTVTGSVVAANGAAILPGGAAVGTFVVTNSLSMSNGSSFIFDLGSVTNAGVGNDLLAVNNLVLGDGTVKVYFNFTNLAPAIDPSSNYALIRYTGTLTTNGTAAFVVQQCPYPATFTNDTVNKQILVSFAAGSATPNNLVWQGWTGLWAGGLGGWTNQLGVASLFFNGDSVQFDDTATNFAVSLPGPVTPGGSTVPIASTNNYTFTGPGGISGSAGLTKSGAGTLSVGTANSYTGNTYINAGEVQIMNLNALGTAAGKTVVASAADLSYKGSLTGNLAEAIDLSGDGLTGAGALQGNDTSTVTNTGTITLVADASVGGTRNVTIAGQVTGGSAFKKLGANTVYLTGTNNYGGATVISNGVLQGTTASLPGTISNYTTLTLDQTFDGVLAGPLNGTGAVIKNNTGMVAITNANATTFSGPVRVNAGGLAAGADNAFGSGPVTLSGGILGMTNYAGTPRLLTNSVTLSANSTVTTVNGDLALTGPVAGATYVLTKAQTSNTLILGGVVSVTNLVVNGGTLLSSNTLTLVNSVNAGLQMYNDGVVSNRGSITLTGNPKLQFYGNSRLDNLGNITNIGGATVLCEGHGTNVFNNYAGTFYQSGGTLYMGIYGQGTFNNLGGNLYVTNGGTVFLGGGYAPGNVTNATGTLNLNSGTVTIGAGGGSFSLGYQDTNSMGVINLNGGTLTMGRQLTLGTGPGVKGYFNFNGGTLVGNAAGVTLMDNTLTQVIVSNGANISIAAGLTNTISANMVDGAVGGGLTNIGAGTLTLSGTNSYAGPTVVLAGTLGVNGRLNGTGPVTVGNRATLAGVSGTIAGNVTVSNNAILSPGGPTAAATLTLGGKLTLQAGSTLDWSLTNNTAIGGRTNDLVTVTGDVELAGPVTLNLNILAPLAVGSYRLINYSGNLVGTPNITVVTPGRFNGYIDTSTSGQINLVSLGTVNLVWRGNLSPNWNLTESNWFNGTGQDRFFNTDPAIFDDTASQFNVSVATTVQPSSVTVNASNAYAFSGTGKISGLTGIAKNGSGVFTLGSTNDFTGAVQVNAGVLRVTTTNALGFASGVTVAAGAQVELINMTHDTRYPFTIAGTGPDGLGAIKATSGNPHGTPNNPVKNVTLTSNATYFTAVSFDFPAPNGFVNGNGFKVTKLGGGNSDIWGAVSNLDEFIINGGQAYSEGYNNNLGTNVTVNPGGSVGIYGNLTQNARVTLNGGSLNGCGGATVANPNAAGQWTGPIILASSSSVGVNLVASDGSHVQFNGPVSGPGALTKTGTNTLFLAGTNIYAGATYLNSGKITLLTNGSILNSAFISVASGALFDVSLASNATLLAKTFLLNSNQALGGLGTVTGAVVAANGAAIVPGSGAVGTFVLTNSLSMSNGSAFVFDLGSVTNVGAGNDLLAVKDLVLGDGTVNVYFNFINLAPAADPSSNYVLIQYSGTLTTNGAVTFAAQQCSYAAAFTVDAVNKQILVSFGAETPTTPNNLVWQGGTGVWAGGIGGWSNALGAASLYFTGDSVRFDDTALNFGVNIPGAVNPGNVVIPVAAANDYNFFGAGGIGGSAGLTKTGAGTLTLGTVNSYTGPTTFGGGTTVVASVAMNGSPSSIGAGSSLVFDGGAMRYTGPDVWIGGFNRSITLNSGGVIDQSGSVTYLFITNLITGNGSLRKTGLKQLIIGDAGVAGNNDYSGNTYIDAGDFQIRHLNALGTTAGKTVVNAGGQLGYGSSLTGNLAEPIDLSGDGNGNGALQAVDVSTVTNVGLITLVTNASVGGIRNFTIASQITGPGAFKKLGATTVYLTGTNNYAGNTVISNGVLQVTTASVPGTINNFATLTIDQMFDGTLVGPLNGNGTVNKNGAFTLALTNVGTCTGPIVVNGGTLAVGANNALGTGTLFLTNGTGVRATDATARTLANSLIMNGPAMTLGSAGTGDLLFTAAAHNNGAALDKILTIANSLVTISGALTNNGAITKRGAGTLVLGGLMGLTAFTNDQGTVQLSSGGAFTNFPNLQIASGAVLDVSASQPLRVGVGKGLVAGRASAFANDIVGGLVSTGTVTVAGAGTAGTLTLSGDLTLGGGTLNFDLANTTEIGGGTNDLIEVGGNLAVGGTVTINLTPLRGYFANGTYRLIRCSGTPSGNAANFAITGTNAFARGSFTVSVSAGGVDLVVSGTSPMLVWLGTGGSTWDMNGTVNWSNTLDSAITVFKPGDIAVFDNTAANRAVTLTGTLTPSAVFVNSSNYVLSGAGKISGVASITKSGNGTFTLGGTGNDFTGLMQVNGGVLQAGSASAFGLSPSITVADGGQVDFTGLTYSRQSTFTVKGFGPDGRGALLNSVGGQHQTACPVGNITLTGDTGVWSPTVGVPWDFFGGTLNGNGYKLTKLGPGRFDMWCNVVNLPELIISEGLLYPEGGNERLGSNVTVGANGQLGLFGTTTNSPRVVLNGGAIYGTGNATLASVLAGPVVLASNSYMGDMYIYSATAALTTHEQMDGEVSGPGALFKGGTNTLFLNASNSYTGDTIVFGGKLTLTGKGSLASPNIFVTSNGVFDVTAQPGFTLAAGQSLHGNSAVVGQVAVGPGSFVQPGTNSIGTLTISSNLVLNGGTLVCEIGSVTNEGGIYNDLLTVAGNLNLAALTTLQLHLTAGTIDTVNPYTLINYAGALQGNTANLTVTSDSRYTFTPDFSVAGKVRVKVTGGGPADLLWAGNYPEIQADWDVAVSPYWNGSQVFYQGDSVTFDNATGSFDVNLVGSLRPRSMLFKANEVTYTFIGAGALGGGAITKIQNGSYTFANSGVNAFTGPLDIQEGTIRFGDGGILGNLPMTVVVTNNGTLAFNRSDTVTVGNPIVGVGTVVQEGSGLLVLSGSRTFLGGVLVNNGTVQCDGTLLAGAGTVTVAGGMLSGTGTIPAPVLVQAAGVIAPGPGRGTLTISSTLTLAGQARMEINKFGATLASDQVRGVSTLTYGGTLVVQASGDALTAGDAFKLFDATTYTGAFASTNLPVLAAGLGWDTSSLAVDGTIRVQHLYLVTGQIALEGYVGLAQDGVGTRAVTFTATTNGLVLGSWTLDLNFAGGVASYSLPSVLANAANLSAKTAWHLRKRLPMDLSSGSATVNFTDPNQLLAGDLTGTNGVDLDDYYRLAAVWYQVNDAADIDGSGKVDLDDYFLLGNRWGQQDEAP